MRISFTNAVTMVGDYYIYVGCKFNTLTLNSGSDNNTISACLINSAPTDNGSGNVIEYMEY